MVVFRLLSFALKYSKKAGNFIQASIGLYLFTIIFYSSIACFFCKPEHFEFQNIIAVHNTKLRSSLMKNTYTCREQRLCLVLIISCPDSLSKLQMYSTLFSGRNVRYCKISVKHFWRISEIWENIKSRTWRSVSIARQWTIFKICCTQHVDELCDALFNKISTRWRTLPTH